MDKAIAKADREEPGSSAKLSKDLKDYYGAAPEEKIQDRAYDAIFNDWTGRRLEGVPGRLAQVRLEALTEGPFR